MATAACAGRSLSVPDGGGGGPCKTYSACAVLTASDVTAATGTKFGAGMENDIASPTAASAERVMCNYATGKTTDPVVTSQVRCCPCGDNRPGSVAEAFGGAGMTVTTVSGVGDSAFWVAPIADAGLPNIDQLIVFVGADLQVVITVSAPMGQTFSFDPLAAAEQMAMVAVSRL
jgi:hypothetical protein